LIQNDVGVGDLSGGQVLARFGQAHLRDGQSAIHHLCELSEGHRRGICLAGAIGKNQHDNLFRYSKPRDAGGNAPSPRRSSQAGGGSSGSHNIVRGLVYEAKTSCVRADANWSSASLPMWLLKGQEVPSPPLRRSGPSCTRKRGYNARPFFTVLAH